MGFTRSGRDILYNNNLVYLAGVHAGTGTASTTDALIPPFDDDMQRLRANNRRNNFHRHWLVPYWNYSPQSTVNPNKVVFVRDAAGKWKLRAFNGGYFTKLNQMIAKAAQLGIVVQLVLFDRCGLDLSDPNSETKRWDHSPWNSANNLNGVIVQDGNVRSGLPEFYKNQANIRAVQQNYIQQVVNQTKNHWNVFYEIMNEPMGSKDGTGDDRVSWADWVVGVIHGLTAGSNLIFFNDHTGGAKGADVIKWKERGLPNYNNFHGVIFHGRPAAYDPADAAYADFSGEKIFQVSSDGFKDTPAENSDSKLTNTAWTNHAFSKKMIYQAHSNSALAADGIGAASPIKPTELV
jgi:hypothetical protein